MKFSHLSMLAGYMCLGIALAKLLGVATDLLPFHIWVALSMIMLANSIILIGAERENGNLKRYYKHKCQKGFDGFCIHDQCRRPMWGDKQ